MAKKSYERNKKQKLFPNIITTNNGKETVFLNMFKAGQQLDRLEYVGCWKTCIGSMNQVGPSIITKNIKAILCYYERTKCSLHPTLNIHTKKGRTTTFNSYNDTKG